MPPVLSAQDWFLAVDSQNHAAIREGLRRFAGIKDELGDTALMHAARSGDLTAVKILVNHEQCLLNSAHETALIQAILQERTNVVRFLRPYEGNINTNDNRTPFMVAASAGCIQSLSILTHHFDLSTNLNGFTALDYAVLGNNLDCTKLIIETQNVTLDQIDYALQLSETQRNKEISMYLLSVRQYIKDKLQGRGLSGRKQLFCIPTNELQQMGTVLDKVVKTRVESTRRPSSARASLTVQIPQGKPLQPLFDYSQTGSTQSAPGTSVATYNKQPGIKPGLAARFLPGVVPSSALNSFLANQTQVSTNLSMTSSSSGAKKTSRPSSARAVSRPSSAQKSHSVHKKARDTKDHGSSHSKSRRDSSRPREHQENDAMGLIVSLNKELGLKTLENIQLQNENKELKKTIALLHTEGKSSKEINAQLESLKKQLEKQDQIIIELEAAGQSDINKDGIRQQCLALHAKVVDISQLLLSKEAELLKLRTLASSAGPDPSNTTADNQKTDATLLAEDLLMMSTFLLQNIDSDTNMRGSLVNTFSDDPATAKSLAFANALIPNLTQKNEQLSALTTENKDLKTRCIELLESLTAAQSEVARLSSLQADNDATQISELVGMKDSQIGELRKRNEALENTALEAQTLYSDLKERYMQECAEHSTLKQTHAAMERELEETKKALAGKNTTINSLIKRMTALRAQAEAGGHSSFSRQYGFHSQFDHALDSFGYDSAFSNDTTFSEPVQSHRPMHSSSGRANEDVDLESDAPSVFLQAQHIATKPTEQSFSLDEKMTPLMQAIVEGNARGVGANLRYLQSTLPDGTTALMLAVQHGRQSFIKYLLEKEAGMRRSDGMTAFQMAIESGNSLAISALEDYEGPPLPEVSTQSGQRTELMQAVEDNYLIDVWSLSRIQAGLTDECSRTALMLAAQIGNVSAVRLLLDKEAHIRDCNGLSALDYARKCPDPAKKDACVAVIQKAISLRM